MTNVTVPLTGALLEFVDAQVADHKADSRAGFIRRLIAEKQEADLLEAHVAAIGEFRARKTLKGNLRNYMTR